jgi:hypothetical protein
MKALTSLVLTNLQGWLDAQADNATQHRARALAMGAKT